MLEAGWLFAVFLALREASQNYVNRMWENLLLAFIGEALAN